MSGWADDKKAVRDEYDDWKALYGGLVGAGQPPAGGQGEPDGETQEAQAAPGSDELVDLWGAWGWNG